MGNNVIKRRGWVENGIGYLPLTRGKVALVDPEDLPFLEQWNWTAGEGDYPQRGQRQGRGRPVLRIRLYTQLLPPPPGYEVDHINRNPLDNRRANLRYATRSQQVGNQRGRNAIKGVSWRADKQRWQARLRCNCHPYHLGYYKTREAALAARAAAAKAHWGDFAYISEPPNPAPTPLNSPTPIT